jgi:hypothetical protein
MAASMVNIADFRCRDLKTRFGHDSARALENSVEPVDATAAERETEPAAENPDVLDIGAARDNPRLRLRTVPLSMAAPRHRSNLVRFNEPQVAVMRINRTGAMESWLHDDYDHPPAA